MKQFVMKRIGYCVLSLFLLSLTIFFFVRVTGDPATLLVEPGASADVETLSVLQTQPPPSDAAVLIGPEGGWTPEEIETGSTTCRLVTLGTRTLRADAMALVALTALFARWREL